VGSRSAALSGFAARPAAGGRIKAAKVLAPGLLALFGLLALYFHVFVHAVDVWRSDPEFSFGFAVPPVAFAVLWLKRRQVAAAAGQGNAFGLIPLIGGLALFVLSVRINIHALSGASLLPMAFGAVSFLHGTRAARLTAFPLAFLTVSLSLYRGMFNSLGFVLQQITASLSAPLASFLGVPVRQAGVDLFTGKLHLVVAQACSGMDSLVALLCIGALIVGIGAGSMPRRAALLSAVLPIILVANVVRVTLVLLLYAPIGSPVTSGPVHDILDIALFVGAALIFWLIAGVLKCAPAIRVTRSSSV